MNYIIVNEYGIVLGGGICQDDAYPSIDPGIGNKLVPNVQIPENQSTYWKYTNGQLIDTNQPIVPPYPWMTWDNQSAQWVDDRTPEEKYADAANKVDTERNALLYQSDWTQIPNNPLTPAKQEEWAIYRQELRDITKQPGYPFNVIWPVQPE